MTPKILFKFINSIEPAAAIASGSLKFTAIAELNDPVEMLPSWNEEAFSASLDHVREHGCTEQELALWREQEALMGQLAPDHMRVPAPRSSDEAKSMARWHVYDDQPLMRERLNAFIAEVRTKIGVLSLSTRFDSLPMWAHYAANASGFLVAYKNIDDGLPHSNVPSLFRAIKVNYDDVDGVTFSPDSYLSIFLRKLPDWRYEDEWRVIADFKSCADLHCPVDRRRLGGLISINPAHVVGFFAGWRMLPSTFEAFKTSVANANRCAPAARLGLDGEGRPDFSPIHQFLAAQAEDAA